MTTCDDMGPLVAGAADGELTKEERDRLDEHLAGCAACRACVAEEELLVGMLEGEVSVDGALVGADLWPEVERRIGARSRAKRLWWVGALAFICVVAKLVDLVALGGSMLGAKTVVAVVLVVLSTTITKNPFALVEDAPRALGEERS